MQPRRDSVIAAGMAFAESSHPDRRDVHPELQRTGLAGSAGRPAVHQRSPGTEPGARSLGGPRPDGALRRHRRGSPPPRSTAPGRRKVLVVVSDGGDNASHTRFEDVSTPRCATTSSFTRSASTISNDRDAKPELLRQLADATGGEAFFPRSGRRRSRRPGAHRARHPQRLHRRLRAAGRRRRRAGSSVRVDVHAPDGRKLGGPRAIRVHHGRVRRAPMANSRAAARGCSALWSACSSVSARGRSAGTPTCAWRPMREQAALSHELDRIGSRQPPDAAPPTTAPAACARSGRTHRGAAHASCRRWRVKASTPGRCAAPSATFRAPRCRASSATPASPRIATRSSVR